MGTPGMDLPTRIKRRGPLWIGRWWDLTEDEEYPVDEDVPRDPHWGQVSWPEFVLWVNSLGFTGFVPSERDF